LIFFEVQGENALEDCKTAAVHSSFEMKSDAPQTFLEESR
jgi:hypothetical protein